MNDPNQPNPLADTDLQATQPQGLEDVLPVALRSEDKARIHAAARRLGLRASTWARMVLLEAVDRAEAA